MPKMPADNRMHSSAALHTHSIWKNVIGDPYAPAQSEAAPSEPTVGPSQNAYQNYRAFLEQVKRESGLSLSEKKGSCRRCGGVGHLTHECRNFLMKKEEGTSSSESGSEESESDDEEEEKSTSRSDQRRAHGSGRSPSRERGRDSRGDEHRGSRHGEKHSGRSRRSHRHHDDRKPSRSVQDNSERESFRRHSHRHRHRTRREEEEREPHRVRRKHSTRDVLVAENGGGDAGDLGDRKYERRHRRERRSRVRSRHSDG